MILCLERSGLEDDMSGNGPSVLEQCEGNPHCHDYGLMVRVMVDGGYLSCH